MGAKGRWSKEKQSYDTSVYGIECSSMPSGSNGSTVGFTGSTGVKDVTKISPGHYKVRYYDAFQWAVPTVSLGLLTGSQVSTDRLAVVLISGSELLSTPTGSVYYAIYSGSLGVAVDISDGGPVNAANVNGVQTDARNKVNVVVHAKIGTVK